MTNLLPHLQLMVVLLGWSCAVLASAALHPPTWAQTGAAVIHVVGLVVAFGTVVVVEWHGLLWLTSRRDLHESIRLAAAANPLIWLGIGGLLTSGALLQPNLSSPMTWTKLLLVLAVCMNGALSARIVRALRDLPRSASMASLSSQLRGRIITVTVISQIGWWGAIAIGFATSIGRS
jgi:hypothetical protein